MDVHKVLIHFFLTFFFAHFKYFLCFKYLVGYEFFVVSSMGTSLLIPVSYAINLLNVEILFSTFSFKCFVHP